MDTLLGRGHRIASELVADWFLERSRADEPTLESWPAPIPLSTLLPAAGQRLDFRQRPYRELVAGGWFDWRVRAPGQGAGWPLSQSGTVCIADAAGELVIEGYVAEGVELPLELQILWNGQSLATQTLERPGPIEIRQRVTNGMPADGISSLRLDVERSLSKEHTFYLKAIAINLDAGS